MTYIDRDELERDGFSIVVRSELDEYPDLSYLGEYSDDPHADRRLSVDVWASEYGYIDNGRPNERPRCYRWFNPAFGCTPNPTLEKLVADRLPHYAGDRHEAYRQVMRERMWDYRRAKTYGDIWSCLIVEAVAYRHGIELGRSSVCGVDSDSGETILEHADEFGLIDEAIESARLNLSKLCAR